MAFTLPRRPPGLVDPATEQIWWQQVVEAIEAQITDLSGVVSDLAAAVAAITAAQTAADAAQASADQAALDSKIAVSYVIPAEVMTAADVGSDCTITIVDHVRRYGDSTELSVTGGTITGLAFSTDYAVYYDDPACSDTTPTYHYTTTASNALNNFVSGRHYVGLITTPADGGAASTGGSNPPGGGGETFYNRFDMP